MASSDSTDEKLSDELYSAPAINPPTMDTMKNLAKKLKFDLTDVELQDYSGCISSMLEGYNKVYRMVEPKPPVKYPRTPGYRPTPHENKYNAWYMKTDIPGAKSGKLLGKTVAVKDNICVAGVPMMNGSKLYEGYIPEFDATVITRTLDAGGRILGKAACENFCVCGNSFTNDIDPVLNPYDVSRTSGGSSSGSASLVASNEVDLALGADQGGSIRIPSSWCGIVGLKPTYGLVPYTGAASIEHTVDHLGPMARTVKDCALFLEVLAGPDRMDSRQPETMNIPEYSQMLRTDLSEVKIGVLKEGFSQCEPDVTDLVIKAVDMLKGEGATVNQVSIPMHSDGATIYSPLVTEGAYETMVRKAGFGPSSKGFHSTSMKDHLHAAMEKAPNSFPPTMKLVCLFGEFLRETNNYHFYSRSTNLVRDLTSAYDEQLEKYDVLVMPTLPCTAPKLPKKNTSVKTLIAQSNSMVGNTAPFDATGHPALSINTGFSGGLPVGMMIVGKKWYEQDVLNVAYAYEGIRDKEVKE